MPVFAEGIASIWTTDSSGTLKTDFAPEETVYIRGENFRELHFVDIDVTRPDGVIESGNDFTDERGSFVYEYLLDGIQGTYTVNANDRKNYVTTTFTDSGIDNECQLFGFDYGVAKWQCSCGNWTEEETVYAGSSVTGNGTDCTLANWNVGTSGADGIVVKAGNTVHYAVVGTSGTETIGTPEFSHITFCGYEFECEIDEDCDDGVYCNGAEQCIDGFCEPGTPIDCSYNDINGIESCFWIPDEIDFTWDYRAPFISVCDEENDLCTEGDNTITHECDTGRCQAECEADSDCPCQKDYCDGNDYIDFPDYGECTDCECMTGTCSGEPCEPTIYFNDPRCGECETDDDCPSTGNQCTENKCIDYYCVETPKEISTSCESDEDLCTIDHCDGQGSCVTYDNVDCSDYDDQCNTGMCEAQTGECYADPFPLSTPCNNDLFCDGTDHCDGFGECVALGTPIDCSYLNDQCNNGVCDETIDDCIQEPEPLSTPCDNDLFCDGEDHCDGLGECVPLGPPIDCTYLDDQCNTGMCDEVNDECVADPEPLSTPCDNELFCDGTDHCDGLGECVNLGPGIDCSYLDDQCNSGVCDEGIDECVADPFPESTPCDNGLYCDGLEHCDGIGQCVNLGPAIDCSGNDLPPVGECNYDPDNYPKTWDYFIGFTSVCDEGNDECTSGTEDVTSTCSIADCGAECESNSNCTPKIVELMCYYDGSCSLEPLCECSYESEYCPEPGTIEEGYCYWGKRDCVDGIGCDLNRTPMGCYEVCDPELGPTGLPELVTVKEVNGLKIECDYLGEENEAEECWFVTTDTSFSLNVDYDGNFETYYRQRWKEDYESEWEEWSEWTTYTEPFNKAEDSIHELEYYSFDEYCDIEEEHHFEIDIVDSQYPEGVKTVGNPKTEWDGENDIFYPESSQCWDGTENEMECWKITMLTPITLDCVDADPHPVGNEEVCYRYFLDGELAQDWVCVEAPTIVYFDEECFHKLEYYCRDELENESEIDSELFKVEGTALRIPLYLKWNLISVPFVLINNDPAEVFKDIDENIESVWGYDSVTDEWFVYRPMYPAMSNLSSIMPGWGYWVSSYDDEVVLVLGGSLMNPVQVPPSKELAQGWNLIGYYGIEWQGYENGVDELFCGENGDEYYGNSVFCSLNSLVDTQHGYPRWSALWGYVNCGIDSTYWIPLSLCGDYNKMYAGKGYWIEMDVEDLYAPATNCIWNAGLYC